MLERLGVLGMSSDESEDDARAPTPRFHILTPVWRDPRVGTWLRTFDSVHTLYRRTHSDRRGAPPRIRVHNSLSPALSDSKLFVSDLPMIAYHKDWLAARTDTDFSVRPTQEAYNFTHDPEIFEYAISPPHFHCR